MKNIRVVVTSTSGLQSGMSSFFSQVKAELEHIRQEVSEKAAQAMRESMEYGIENGKKQIEMAVTKTGLERELLYGGEPGRIETDKYHGSFGQKVDSTSGDEISGRFGWLEEDRPAGIEAHRASGKTYFELQDTGFQSVPGVHAMLDSSILIKDEFKTALTKYVEEAFS